MRTGRPFTKSAMFAKLQRPYHSPGRIKVKTPNYAKTVERCRFSAIRARFRPGWACGMGYFAEPLCR